MAAQKLTKGRFAQIIIMLTLLIVAFFWRTITYKETINVDCKEHNICSFKVNETIFTAQKRAEMLLINTNDSGWTIQGHDNPQGKPWQLSIEQGKNLQLLNEQQQEYSVNLSF